ncbi:MAG: hypothetical protein AAGF24_14145 [Cyanobacteria bacterium P01_H01_bin.121]
MSFSARMWLAYTVMGYGGLGAVLAGSADTLLVWLAWSALLGAVCGWYVGLLAELQVLPPMVANWSLKTRVLTGFWLAPLLAALILGLSWSWVWAGALNWLLVWLFTLVWLWLSRVLIRRNDWQRYRVRQIWGAIAAIFASLSVGTLISFLWVA